MNALNDEMKRIIRNYNAGLVASVNDDGSPAVSPKATFVVVDETRIAYGNIRSPNTSANLRQRPAVEVNFIDVLARLAVRVRGQAQVVAKDSAAGQALLPLFEEYWAPYLEHMQEFVSIDIDQAQLIRSPGYDVGFSREELVETNLEKLNRIANE